MYLNQKICIIAYKVIIKCVALLYNGILLFCLLRQMAISAHYMACGHENIILHTN